MISILRRKKPSKPIRKVSQPQVGEDHIVAAELALNEALEKHPMSYIPILEWRRYSVTAGMAHYQHGMISLSAVVLKDPGHIRETLLHEYAHLLAFDRHGRKGAGHGKHWKQAMMDLGLEPKVHHHYEVVRNQSRQVVVYRCKKCGEKFSRKRQMTRSKRYFHRQCGGQIAFVEVQRATIESDKT
ncbi:MAG: SprT-like domain-containing protein [Armatimonadota bacterium]